MDITRERELRCIVACVDGDIVELQRCIDEGVNLECRATPDEIAEYRQQWRHNALLRDACALPPGIMRGIISNTTDLNKIHLNII